MSEASQDSAPASPIPAVGAGDAGGDDVHRARTRFVDGLSVDDDLVDAASRLQEWGLEPLFQDWHPGCLAADSFLSGRLEARIEWLWLGPEDQAPPDVSQFRRRLRGLTAFCAEADSLFPCVAVAAASATDVTSVDVEALVDEAPDYFYGQRPTSIGRAAINLGWSSTSSLAAAAVTLDLGVREHRAF